MAETRGGWPIFTAAAVQAAPVYLNRDATVDKACGLIHEAGWAGARLIVFPEAFVPGFPHWIYLDRPQANEQYFVDLVREAVEVPGPVTETIGPVWARVKIERPVTDLSIQGTGKQFNWDIVYPGPDGKFGTADDRQLLDEVHVSRGW